MGLIANSILVNIDRISELLGRPEGSRKRQNDRKYKDEKNIVSIKHFFRNTRRS